MAATTLRHGRLTTLRPRHAAAKMAGVDEDAGELVADGAMDEGGGHG